MAARLASQSSRAIAWYTLVEARSNRLLWLAGAFLLAGFVVAEFVAEVAITEVDQFQAGFIAAWLRVSAVFIISLFVTTSVVREFNDKVLELILATEVPRASYFVGKLVGFFGVGLVVAVMYGAMLLLYAPAGPALAWTLSLACELALVVAACLLALFTFGQVMAALSTVFAFYLLSRSIAAIQSMSDSPLLYSSSLGQQAIGVMVDGLAFLLPGLDAFTRSSWVIHAQAPWADLAVVGGQTAIYVCLLGAAALFDLYRKNL